MNRRTLQSLAVERIDDARALLSAGRWSGGYYLAGYAVELALKSAVLAYIDRTGRIFTDRKFAEKCWTHNLAELLELADLTTPMSSAVALNASLGTNWKTAASWAETSRYNTWSQVEAEQLVIAVDHPHDGVLIWLKAHW